MNMNAHAVAGLLINKGLVSTDSIVNGEFQVTDVSRRNRNYRVDRGNSEGYFIKQLQSHDPQAAASFRCEAAVHWLAQNDPDFKVLNDLSPHCQGYDPTNNLIVTDLIGNAKTLSEALMLGLTTEQAYQLGKLLSTAHWHSGRNTLKNNLASPFQRQVPWILRIPKLSITHTTSISEANRMLLQTMQTTQALSEMLTSVESAWTYQSLIHGDLKPDNCLIVSDSESSTTKIQFVDWELADFGDPAWDVGTLLQGIWLPSLIHYGHVDAQGSFLEPVQQTLATFLKGYLNNSPIQDDYKASILYRFVQFAATRMLQSAYELLYDSKTVTTQSIQILQSAITVFANPGVLIGRLGRAHG